MKALFYAAIIVILLYAMDVRVIVDLVDGFRDTWNYFVDFVLTFRYKQPLAFTCLPFVAIWLLGRK